MYTVSSSIIYDFFSPVYEILLIQLY
jgi:kynurenine 3-monooxygenase